MNKINIRNLIDETFNTEKVGLLNEASFSQSGLRKVSDLLAIVLGRDLGGEFKLLGAGLGEETFKKKKFGQGQGFRYINKKGYMIRFGWLKKAKKSKYQINIVDLWEPGTGAKWDTPTITVKIADWMNIVEVVKDLKFVLATGKVADSLVESKEELLEAAYVPKKMIAYATSLGFDYNGESEYKLKKTLEDEGVWDDDEYKGFKVTHKEKEQNSSEGVFKENEKKLKAIKYSDPDLIFSDIEKLAKIVATGGANGLVIVGNPGIGKCAGKNMEVNIKGLETA